MKGSLTFDQIYHFRFHFKSPPSFRWNAQQLGNGKGIRCLHSAKHDRTRFVDLLAYRCLKINTINPTLIRPPPTHRFLHFIVRVLFENVSNPHQIAQKWFQVHINVPPKLDSVSALAIGLSHKRNPHTIGKYVFSSIAFTLPIKCCALEARIHAIIFASS